MAPSSHYHPNSQSNLSRLISTMRLLSGLGSPSRPWVMPAGKGRNPFFEVKRRLSAWKWHSQGTAHPYTESNSNMHWFGYNTYAGRTVGHCLCLISIKTESVPNDSLRRLFSLLDVTLRDTKYHIGSLSLLYIFQLKKKHTTARFRM